MPFSLRYWLKLIQAFILRFKGVIIIGILVGVLFFFFFRFFLFPFLAFGKRERIGIAGKYRIDSLPTEVLSLISYGLTKIGPDGSFEPMLAEFWETPDKGKTWIFHLDDNFSWQDGSKVRSSDISYNFSDVEIEKPDEKTIVFKLKNPFSPFPAVVSKPVFKKGLLGTGNWKVKSVSISSGYVKNIILVDKNKNQKIYKFYPTEEKLKLAFKLGQVDILKDVFNPEPFDKWNIVELEKEADSKKIVTIFFNTNDKYLSEKTIRQALYYSIDRNQLSQNKAISPIYPESWAYNPLVKPYDFDFEKAKKIIESLPDEIKKEMEVNITTTPMLLPVGEKIVKMWQDLELKTKVQTTSSIPEEYQALLVIFESPPDPDQYSIWHTTQTAMNYSKYKNPRIDALLEEGRSKLDIEERRKIYLDFQRFLLEDAPAAFLYHPEIYTISRKSSYR